MPNSYGGLFSNFPVAKIIKAVFIATVHVFRTKFSQIFWAFPQFLIYLKILHQNIFNF